jgi:DNA-binding winged helix-turn-helix (wHTH) protein
MKKNISCIINNVPQSELNAEQTYFLKNTLHLTEKEFQLFLLLLQRKGETVSHADIINFVWPERSAAISKNNILQLIFRLRKKLTRRTNTALIKTISGKGYMLETSSKPNTIMLNSHKIDGKLNRGIYILACIILVAIIILPLLMFFKL